MLLDGQNPLTIGKIEVKDNYTGEIRLATDLIISGQNSLGDSLIDSTAKIAPQNASSDLVIDGTKLVVRRGELGSTTHKSEIRVINKPDHPGLEFDLTSGVKLGMELVIGTAGGGTGAARVLVHGLAPGFNGGLLVTNDANIMVNKDSRLMLWGEDGDGSIEDDGLTSGYVRVEGKVERAATGEVEVELPFLVKSGGEVKVTHSTLTIDAPGIGATSNRSLYVESGGKVGFHGTSPVLKVSDDAEFAGGKLEVLSGAAQFHAVNLVEFNNNATFSIETTTQFATVTFVLTGPGATVNFVSGTWSMRVGELGMHPMFNDRVGVTGGSLDISPSNTTLAVAGLGSPPDSGIEFHLIGADDIDGDFATFDPTGWALTKSIEVIGDSDRLVVTTV